MGHAVHIVPIHLLERGALTTPEGLEEPTVGSEKTHARIIPGSDMPPKPLAEQAHGAGAE